MLPLAARGNARRRACHRLASPAWRQEACFAGGTNAPVKRFYKKAHVSEAGDAVQLDGRALRTPERSPVVFPTSAAAAVVAAEWDAQSKYIMPNLMPLTRLAMTAIDRTPLSREGIIQDLMPYVDTDTVCFWEDPDRTATSAKLHEMQAETYQPVIDWFSDKFGGQFAQTTGLFVTQPAGLKAEVQSWMEGLDDWTLTCLDGAVRPLKSFALGAAVMDRHYTSEHAVAASRLEELHQAMEWGYTEGADGMEGAELDLRVQVGSAALLARLTREDFGVELDLVAAEAAVAAVTLAAEEAWAEAYARESDPATPLSDPTYDRRGAVQFRPRWEAYLGKFGAFLPPADVTPNTDWGFVLDHLQQHKRVLVDGGVWSEVEMSDRVRVNAGRVGLEVQEGSTSDPSVSYKVSHTDRKE